MENTIKHHLTPAVLMAYASGTLPEAFNLMVATHISLCDTCRAEADSYDALGGEILESNEHGDIAMSATSFDDVMAMIAREPDPEIAKPAPRSDSILPAPLQDYVGGDLKDIKWRSVGMGVKQAILKTSSEASARLLFIPAGAAMPDHSHNGIEMTMVLQGAFQDEFDYFARGDVEIADSDVHHTPVADIREDCICLAVTDAPLKFRGLIPKLAQPFLRI